MKLHSSLQWDIIRSEYIHRSKWLTVRKDWVRTSNGVLIDDFFVLEYPTWVNVVARTIDGQYILERQYRHGIQQCVYEICAGVCESGEEPLATAKRELLEETGYAGGEWTMIGKYAPNPNSMSNWCYSFFADGVKCQASIQQEETEDNKIVVVNKEQLISMMQDGHIAEGVMLAPLWQHLFSIPMHV